MNDSFGLLTCVRWACIFMFYSPMHVRSSTASVKPGLQRHLAAPLAAVQPWLHRAAAHTLVGFVPAKVMLRHVNKESVRPIWKPHPVNVHWYRRWCCFGLIMFSIFFPFIVLLVIILKLINSEMEENIDLSVHFPTYVFFFLVASSNVYLVGTGYSFAPAVIIQCSLPKTV